MIFNVYYLFGSSIESADSGASSAFYLYSPRSSGRSVFVRRSPRCRCDNLLRRHRAVCRYHSRMGDNVNGTVGNVNDRSRSHRRFTADAIKPSNLRFRLTSINDRRKRAAPSSPRGIVKQLLDDASLLTVFARNCVYSTAVADLCGFYGKRDMEISTESFDNARCGFREIRVLFDLSLS